MGASEKHEAAYHDPSRDQLAETIRTVRVGPFGPNTLPIIQGGGMTRLTEGESGELVDVILGSGWLAEQRAEAARTALLGLAGRLDADVPEKYTTLIRRDAHITAMNIRGGHHG